MKKRRIKMQQILLDKKHDVMHDGRQFVLRVYKGERKKPLPIGSNAIWEAYAYDRKLENVLETYMDKKIGDSNATTIPDLIKEVKELRAYIKQICEGEAKPKAKRGRPKKAE